MDDALAQQILNELKEIKGEVGGIKTRLDEDRAILEALVENTAVSHASRPLWMPSA